ncbi:MAG: MFS transporter [Proteobacteria bacterium]|nr:MFS transporter [Pseudomonadota bacterium]
MSSSSVTAAPWRALLPVYVACLAFGVQVGAALPLVPLALERRGVDNFTIGLVSAAWGIGMISTAHRIPAVAARIGATPLICLSLLVTAVIAVAFAYTESTVLWFGLSLLSGVSGGVPWVVSEIWINLVVDERRRGRAVAVYSTLVALGLAVGPVVLQVVGVYGPRPFLVTALLTLLIALPLLPSWRTAPVIEESEAGGFWRIVRLAPLPMLAVLACGLGEQAAFSFLPVYAVMSGIAPQTGAMWLSAFVIGNLVLQWPIGWAADHWDRRKVLAGCALFSAAMTILLPMVDLQSPGILALLVAWGGISFGIYTVGLALLGQRFAGGDIAVANAAFTIFYTMGGLVGRPIIGAVMDIVGDAGFGPSIAFFYLVAGVGALLALRWRG